MAQINFHVTPEFERALESLMRERGIASKSEAIRFAVQQTAAPYLAVRRDLSLLEGLVSRHTVAKVPRKPMARFEREIDDEMERALQKPTRKRRR